MASSRPELPQSFSKIRKVHIIGVCGTLMAPFAVHLKKRGLEVSGSDQNVYPPMSEVLAAAGVELFQPFSPENLKRAGSHVDLIVVGNVISASNPEMQAAAASGLPFASLPEVMERFLLPKTRNLVVAGTHGKTTTATLLAHVLKVCGKDPSYFFGGVSHDLPESFHVAGEKGCFVLEGDEYDTAYWDKVPKFNHYLPDDVILTSVEFDHADIYRDLEHVKEAFRGLVARVRPGGKIISCLDFPAVAEVTAGSKAPLLTYSANGARGARFEPRGVRLGADGAWFEVWDSGKKVDELRTALAGMHNVGNVLAVWILGRELELDPAKLREAMASYRGVKRRTEVRGEEGGVLVIDDFAHHPTAVRTTLLGLRSRYSGRKLITVFEPRSATSRRKVFQKDYVDALAASDQAFIATPYDQTRIGEEDRFSTADLVADLNASGTPASSFGIVEMGVEEVARAAKPGDLIAVLSNGGFGGFISKLIARLKAGS
ncbi:MAG: UDP-N-acetylmuramate:L-alanyl-gamma-D-glutamyl-meso-diaminopimelate ligase [Bdellovibrionales bacterium]|nr:UDP-N-acetylmuramate:L-alanyl-gamma-D-glutamyl-meso-diaminopimelate ligase [Bdellovibrionales bacterium]